MTGTSNLKGALMALELDPLPFTWPSGTRSMFTHGDGQTLTFAPRPGYDPDPTHYPLEVVGGPTAHDKLLADLALIDPGAHTRDTNDRCTPTCPGCAAERLRAALRPFGGIAGHCIDIDGNLWHAPGTCTECRGSRCCTPHAA